MVIKDSVDITDDQYEILRDCIKKHLPNTEVWIYGSRVKGTSRSQSDLDMVVFATPQQKLQVSDLKDAFEDSNLPFRVDLFVWDEVPESFRKTIQSEHLVFI